MSELCVMGNDILRQISTEVQNFNGQLENNSKKMHKIMLSYNGIGLAAPQIGISNRLFVYQLPNEQMVVMINPQIMESSLTVEPYEEGCLSIPGINADIIRPDKVTVQYQNLGGKIITKQFKNLEARVIQHELDHLNGVLFIDHLDIDEKKNKIREFRQIQMNI